MSNVAIVTSLPHLGDHIKSANIDFFSKLMLTAPSLSVAILAPFIGSFVYFFGKKRSAILGLFIFALFGSTGLYLTSIELLLASRVIFGIGIAILMIVSTSFVGDYFTGDARNSFLSKQNSFVAIGGIFFVIGGSLLCDIYWRLPFGIYLIGVLLIPAVMFFIKEVQNQNEETNTSSKLNKDIYLVFLMAFIYMCIFFAVPTQMPFLMMQHYGASATTAGGIVSTAFVASAAGALMFGFLKKRLSFAYVYATAIFVVSIGFILIGIFTHLHSFFISAFITGFGGGIALTNMSAWMLSKTNLKTRIKATAFLSSSIFLGQFFSPIASHPFIEIFGVQHFFGVVGFINIALIGVFLIFSRLKK